MSGTLRRIHVVVTVSDSDHWTPEDLAATGDADLHQFVVDELVDRLQPVVDEYIREHPSRFMTEVGTVCG